MGSLHPYLRIIGGAVLESFFSRAGRTITVEIARQGGKNEVSAYLEAYLLLFSAPLGGNAIKAAPTLVPQGLISLRRLQDRLDAVGLQGLWLRENGYIIRLDRARQMFLSADGASHVVGATAHILLEVDEAQDVAKEKFYKEFRPMGASTNVTTVLYGTTWDDASLLEEMKHLNLEQERKDGHRRHFRFDWQEVAKYNPDYLRYVEEERARLGEEHPLFRTQYRLLPIVGGGGLFSPGQRAQLQGTHPRQRQPQAGAAYVAGLDIGGEGPALSPSKGAVGSPHDATVLTIGQLDFSIVNEVIRQPGVRVVEHYRWHGTPHPQLYGQLLDLLRNVWACRRVVVDATGLGQGIASFLSKAMGGVVEQFLFTAQSKSRLGFDLLAAVNAGRAKLYAADGSLEYQEFWREVEQAKVTYRPNQSMDFFVPAAEGHDDFLMSLALLVRAADGYTPPRQARGRVRE
jgi:hypothetical protein